ncbi:MAG: HD domain-containing phosphohydrolase [Wenzhouxiangella sp.]|jgi:HD-GYP domain-containing protein (c-di-GMP phosphodiesterase class II)/CheY-like chemotaxis protein|nr:HD domain-containing phosphohydrolase [Wenzhouxiangella sp.]
MQTISWDKVQHALSGSIFRVAPSELKLGHTIVRLDRDWAETPWAGPTLVLEDLAQKAFLKEHCEWVVIDLDLATNRYRPPAWRLEPLNEALPPIPSRVDALQRSSLDAKALKKGAAVYADLHARAREFAMGFQQTGEVDAAAARDIARRLCEAINESLAALLWLSRIKDPRLYITQHIINTTILAGGFVHALQWDAERVETAAMVGLFHDIGKVRLQRDLLFKAQALSEHEREEARTHPQIASELLRRNPEIAWEVIAAVQASHERPDGTGYPRGLRGDAIPVMARLIAIVDAYDAMTSRRAHGRLLSHQQAMGVLWKERDRQFDGVLIEAFIKFLGWVTPGTLVKLDDQRLAVVMEMRHHQGNQPVVRPLASSATGVRIGGELVLRPRFGGGQSEGPTIADILPDNHHEITMRELTKQLFGVLGERGDAAIAGVDARDLLPEEKLAEAGADVPQSEAIQYSQESAGAHSSSPTRQLALADGLRVLIIDDSLTVRRSLQHMLEAERMEVIAVDSGEAGIREVRHSSPDLLFLDILLPGISGFSTLRRIRQLTNGKDLPVVMISGNPQATEQFFLDRIGADDFLPKPFDQADVAACLSRLLWRSRLPQADALKSSH